MLLEVKDLSFSYREGVDVFSNISFELDRGMVLGVLGENGVGKSTLFKCILGFLSKYRGNIAIDGVDSHLLTLKERGKKIAYIPQSHYPTFNHLVINIVEMGINPSLGEFSMPTKQHREMAMNILVDLGIGHLATKGYKEISGGERQLVLIGRAIMQNAQLLIMDEPTANLDFGNQIKVLKVCEDLAGKGYGIIHSTHHPAQAFGSFHKVLLLHGGKILGFGNTEDVLTKGNLSKVYGVDLEIVKVMVNGREKTFITPKE